MSEPTPPSPSAPAETTAAVAATPAAAAAAAAPKPVIPPKPAPAKPADKGPSRRFFVLAWFGSWFTVAWVAFTGSMLALVLGTVRFLFPNVLSEPPTSFRAGDASGYEDNKVDDKFKELGAWVIRAKDERNRDIIYALSTTCTHLGCTPNWLEGEKKFKCPCHGSGFKISGVNFEGPAPRPLERYAIKKNDDGTLVVDKSRKFQKELGQWEDGDSYILV
ncbi:MAG: ubiquinol-cytochrome c reductase iron-sulfur subunit [Gemmataceae bacterium]